MRIEDAEAVALAGGEGAHELVVGLLAEIAALRGRVEELERLESRTSLNSSLAPSRDLALIDASVVPCAGT